MVQVQLSVNQLGVGGWVKRKLEPAGSTAPTGKPLHASAGEEFLQRLNPNVTTVQGLAYASYPCTMVWHNMGARDLTKPRVHMLPRLSS